MSKMIQVRNVPDKLHRELTRCARAGGETLTEVHPGAPGDSGEDFLRLRARNLPLQDSLDVLKRERAARKAS